MALWYAGRDYAEDPAGRHRIIGVSARRLVAEVLATAALGATVTGSGIIADEMTGDVALTLLANTLVTGAMLLVLITGFGPLSGVNLKSVLTLVFAMPGQIALELALGFVLAQVVGGVVGTLAAHATFELRLLQVSEKV